MKEARCKLRGESAIIEALRRYLPDPDATVNAGGALAPGFRGGMILTFSGVL